MVNSELGFMKSVHVAVLVMVLSAGCAGEDREPPSTQRERDSVIGASKLPGAAGVRGALTASDSAAARNARLDSLGR